jgi:uncharacterized protein
MRLFTLSVAACLMAGTALAAETDAKLPDQLAWTAYDTGSAGYNQAVAIGAALQSALGTNLRVLPGKNDVSRNEPLRQGKVQFSANGVGGSFMAQEGVFEFGDKNWGPQPVRVLLANNGGTVGLAMAVAAEACEKAGKPNCEGFEYSDLKGMRVSWVKGAPALNVNNEAYLAYGGLTWDDVERVEFGGFGDSWGGMIDGSTDAAFASTNSGKAYEAASSPRGVYWPPVDKTDEEALKRMEAVAPFFSPMTATVGANIDGVEGGVPTAGYAYPVLMTYADQDEDVVYNMTKAMVELYPNYAASDVPGIKGWAVEFQDFDWVAPYHPGAIKYFKEIGVWTDEAQARNDQLIARQDALKKAWDELAAENPDNWEEAWDKKRRDALKAGGFEVVF